MPKTSPPPLKATGSPYQTEEYMRLQRLITALRPYDTKKDLRRAPDWVRKDYYVFRKWLRIDKRLAPARVKAEMARFKPRALLFKAAALNYPLTKSIYFDANDWYDSSDKLVAIVTDAMMRSFEPIAPFGLAGLKYEREMIHIAYNEPAQRMVVTFDWNPDFYNWLEFLPSDVMVNILGTAYNKQALQFLYDYNNQSADFAKNLDPLITNETVIKIYRK